MDLKEDVIPIAELKHQTEKILARVKRTRSPILVTQHGRGAAIILNVVFYQAQQRRLKILEEIAKGEKEILEGKGISHSEVVRKAKTWQ